MTVSLSEQYKDIITICNRKQVLKYLYILVDTLNCHNEFRKFKPLIHFLKQPTILKTLKDWAENDNQISQLLLDFINATKDENIVGEYLSKDSIKKQYKDKLEIQYISAMLTQQVLPLADEDYFLKIKLWVLYHAIHRMLNFSNNNDIEIKYTADKARLACNNDKKWVPLFLNLELSAKHFSNFNYKVNNASEKKIEIDSAVNKERPFYTSLNKVSLYENHPSKSSYVSDVKDKFLSSDSDFSEIKPFDLDKLKSTNVFSDENINLDIIDTNDDNIQTFVTTTDPLKSYWEQRLETNSIFLTASSKNNFLPYDWHQLSSFEKTSLDKWVIDLLKAAEKSKQILGLIIWISIKIGASLKFTLSLTLSLEGQLDKNWHLNLKLFVLQRLAASRKNSWQPKSDKQNKWITSYKNQNIIYLNKLIKNIISTYANKFTNANYIGELWINDWESPEILFNKFKPENLKRVTHGMLSQSLKQEAFEESYDNSYSKLISSHSNTALPGACAYPGWEMNKVQKTLNKNHPIDINSEHTFGLGSQLDPVESLLKEEIKNATDALLKIRRESNGIDFHNAFTAYLTTALLAATGGRSIKDPFESANHFDFKNNFVYIDDKFINNSSARIVPIPDILSNFIKVYYKKYLFSLSQQVFEFNPSLSIEIQKLSALQSSNYLPFFFFIEIKDSLKWVPVSEKNISSLKLFNWPLPLNLFRHRLSNKLRQNKVNYDIIDGILGHSENNTAPYSHYSSRCWQDDMKSTTEILNSIFKSLGFSLNKLKNIYSYKLSKNKIIHSNILQKEKSYGLFRRRENRILKNIQIRKNARKDIDFYLKMLKKTLYELDENEIDILSKKMLFNDKALPRTSGAIRYHYLDKRIEFESKTLKKQIKVSKRYTQFSSNKSIFTLLATKALPLFYKLKETTLNSSFKLTDKQKQQPSTNIIFSALLLIFENRISSINYILDILKLKNFRVISFKDKFYIEYAHNLVIDDPFAKVQRRTISSLNAELLNQALKAKTKRKISQHLLPKILPKTLKVEFENILKDIIKKDSSIETIIRVLVQITDQANAIELPGILSGFLSNQFSSTSLNWLDWLRLHHKKPLSAENFKEVVLDDTETNNNRLSNILTLKKETESEVDELRVNAYKLFKNINIKIKESAAINKNESLSANERAKLNNSINKIIDSNVSLVSTSIQVICRYISQLPLKRIKESGKVKYIALSSIGTYISVLSTRFKRVAYNNNCIEMSSDELTDFYTDLINASDNTNTGYFCDRLLEFHRFARSLGIEEPDWDEIPLAKDLHHVSPGFFSESEYIEILQLINNTSDIDNEDRIPCSFLLLCCYRFLLRSNDAKGLLQGDYQNYDDITLLIKNNKIRAVKSKFPRKVPLLFELDDIETNIINKQLALSKAESGDNYKATIFTNLQLENFKKYIEININCIRYITYNPKMVLHHGRHSGAHHIASKLFNLKLPKYFTDALHKSNSVNMKKILLSRDTHSQREVPALAQVLGHVSAKTTFQNYLHFLGEYCDKQIHLKNVIRKNTSYNNINYLDKYTTVNKKIEQVSPSISVQYQTLKPALILKFMRLLAKKKSAKNIGELLSLHPNHSQKISEIIEDISSGMNFDKKKSDNEYILLNKINENAYSRLIEQTEKIEEKTKKSTNILLPNNTKIENNIGSRRQFLFWNEEHINLIEKFCNYFSIKQEDDFFVIIKKENASLDIEKYIKDKQDISINKKLNFTTEISYLKTYKSFKFDAATCEAKSEKNEYSRRATFIFKENSKFFIRNSYEFIICLIAYYSSCIRHSSPL